MSLTTLLNLERLAQPIGGLFSHIIQLPSAPGEPQFSTFNSSLGDVNQILTAFSPARESRLVAGSLNGSGGGLQEEEGRLKALAEGLERYSSCVYDDRQLIWATADELGDEALDLDTLPRCSEAELAHPRCPLLAPDKGAPMRWVRGVSLIDRRLVWIPAILAYLNISPLSPGERIAMPISTGCAAHISLEKALLSAMCEVIERDAISLTWLQKLPLPRIEFDVIPPRLQNYLARYERGQDQIERFFFDATTDLGVPTVYSLHLSPNNESVAALVMCSTELDPAIAVTKVMHESASSRIALQLSRTIPESWDDFIDVFHGAVYMGRRERLSAYEFLLSSPHRRRLSEMPAIGAGAARQDLAGLIQRFRERKMEALAVDLTTDEAMRAGMRVVKVIIPALQPLSFSYRARYLAHPRLYEAPRRMGYQAHTEPRLNPWPQPFA